MATTVVAAIADKRARASQLRSEALTINDELTQASRKLETARRALGSLESKRLKFTEAAADGNPPKPADVATLNTEISTAQISVDGLTTVLNGKQAALDTIRANQETLGREIAIEENQEARRARFEELAKQGHGLVAVINEKIRALIEDDLPALDLVRDSLANEFVNVGGRFNMEQNDPEVSRARGLLHQLGQMAFMDGSFLAVERRLLRSGEWTERGDIQLPIKNLKRPRR